MNKTWSIVTDFQYRSQSRYKTGSQNLFDNTLTNSARVWLNYRATWGTVVFSPFAWFRNFDYSSNNDLVSNDEIRAALGYQKNIDKVKYNLAGRILLEHRQFYKNNSEADRLRYQIKFRPNIFGKGHSPIQPYVQEEYFMRLNPGKLSDQNRVQLGFRFKKNKIELTAAYQWNKQLSNTWIQRHQLYTCINYIIK